MKKLTTDEFIKRSDIKHNNKYDYSKSIYTGMHNPVTIICPEHGEFEQSPNNHAKSGCVKCHVQNQTKSKDKFVFDANVIHKNLYDYCNSKYINTNIKVDIICKNHGVFSQTPANHLRGQGCPKCGSERTALAQTHNNSIFINKAGLIHNYIYTYQKCNYIFAKTKVVITCPIHGDFEQVPDSHLKGRGCPSCAASGFNIAKPAYLYYLKITTDTNQVLYKIGITNRTVNERFNLTDLSKIKIVKQKLYEVGQDALDWETKLKRMYKEYQYKGPDILSSGNTELFTEDILELYLSQYRMD